MDFLSHFVGSFMANRKFWSKTVLRMYITNRLETGLPTSMIYESIGNWGLYI